MTEKQIRKTGEPDIKATPGKVAYVVETKGRAKESAVVNPCQALARLVKFHGDALGCKVTLDILSDEWCIVGAMTDLEDANSTFSTMLLVGRPEDLEAPLMLARMLNREISACREFVAAVRYASAAGTHDTLPAPAGTNDAPDGAC